MRRVVVSDLDGTLCDDRHRVQFAREQLWHAYHSASPGDSAILQVRDLLWTLERAKYSVIFYTGRSERYRKITEAWLRKHFRRGEARVLMRGDDDLRSATILKLEMLDRAGLTPGKVAYVLDNDPRMMPVLTRAGYYPLLVGYPE